MSGEEAFGSSSLHIPPTTISPCACAVLPYPDPSPNLTSRCAGMENSASSVPSSSSTVQQPSVLSPFELQELLDPTQGLLQDRARRSESAKERPMHPTLYEFRVPKLRVHPLSLLMALANRMYTARWQEVSHSLEQVDDSERAVEELLGPDPRHERDVQLEDANYQVCSLDETDLRIEDVQKRLNEQKRAIQPLITPAIGTGQSLPTGPRQISSTNNGRFFELWPIFRIAALSEGRTWSIGLGRRSG